MENSETISNNKRMAQNAIMLYVRMFIMMGITLYTSRIVLNTLGVEDFGIYNIVGGIVILFSFINGAMVASTQRFLNFELGRGNINEARKIFSASLNIYLVLIIIFIVLAETIGFWFLNNYINIPENRKTAANWVYQATIITTIFNFIRTPYNATIISYEHMSFYAYISIIEALFKLGIVYALIYFSDKLVSYAWLIAFVSISIFLIYMIFCKKTFPICKYSFSFDKQKYISLLSFSSWSLIGQVSNIGASQGLSIILNIFFGVIVNTALGIANQIYAAVYQFITNFQTAFNPQIVKSYAIKDKKRFTDLFLSTSKYSYYLTLIIALPIFICCEELLKIWLGIIPPYSVIFCKLIIVTIFFDALSGPLWISVHATGNIKIYQSLISILLLLTIPIALIIVEIGGNPYLVLSVKLIINIVIYIFRLFYCKRIFTISLKKYIIEILKCTYVLIISYIISFSIHYFIHSPKIILTVLFILCSIIISLILIYIFGLSKLEKQYVNTTFIKLYQKLKNSK